ncbi:MAG: hypothetical protein IPL65_22425 [Lewinellaceae bacterium]|nr:hypothetical protein [Lewinellaceae bacterium]
MPGSLLENSLPRYREKLRSTNSRRAFSQLYATDNFHFIDYEFRNEGNDCTSLYINRKSTRAMKTGCA